MKVSVFAGLLALAASQSATSQDLNFGVEPAPAVALKVTEPGVRVDSSDPAAEHFAKVKGISVDDAAQRLSVQQAYTGGNFESEFGERYAGEFITQDDGYQHVVVRLKGETKVSPRSIETQAGPMPIVFKTGALDTVEELRKKAEDALPALQNYYPNITNTSADIRDGTVIVYVRVNTRAELAKFIKSELATIRKLVNAPVKITGGQEEKNTAATFPIYGNAVLQSNNSWCTAGFPAQQKSTGIKGFITAGHCLPTMIYSNYETLPENYSHFVSTAAIFVHSGPADWAFHPAPTGYSVKNYVYAKTRSAADLNIYYYYYEPFPTSYIGREVCWQGVRTGYSCGNISDVRFKKESTCGAAACTATFIKLEGDATKCDEGDSGAGAFVKGAAYGLMVACKKQFADDEFAQYAVMVQLTEPHNAGIKIL